MGLNIEELDWAVAMSAKLGRAFQAIAAADDIARASHVKTPGTYAWQQKHADIIAEAHAYLRKVEEDLARAGWGQEETARPEE